MPINLILIVVAALGPIFTFGAMRARELIVVDGARTAERDRQTSLCNERVLAVGREHDAHVDAGAREAEGAAAGVSATPTVPTEILALCQSDDACRSRRVP